MLKVAARAARFRSGMTDVDLLRALEPVAAANLERLRALAPTWPAAGTAPWDPRQVAAAPFPPLRSAVVRLALQVNLVLADEVLCRDALVALLGAAGPWAAWATRWGAAKARHATALSDYLSVTSAAAARADEVSCLRRPHQDAAAAGTGELLPLLVAAAARERGTAVSYRAIAGLAAEPVATELLGLLADEDELYSAFHRDLVAAAMELAPSRTVRAVAAGVLSLRISSPGGVGATTQARMIAGARIYDLRIHLDQVLLPLLRSWRFFDVEGLDAAGARAREQVLGFLMGLDEVSRTYGEGRPAKPAADRSAAVPLPRRADLLTDH